MAKSRRKVHRAYSKIRRRSSKRGGFGGVIQPIIAGAILGAGVTFAGPYLNSMLPKIGPVQGTELVLLGGGVAAKALLHKDPMHLATGAILLGTAMIVGDAMAGAGGLPGGGAVI
jgi:hypothetical protein